ncbi:hypothetical protein BDZ91DRAFT_721549 [Kalaharituber pfeilii]|nr:hypothetical protein BDZ91DRAFT_721549 [Kalaharituber pfeilii]
MADPASQVAPPLLTHLHCVSKTPYPPLASITVEMIGEMLLKAPQTAQQYPFTWTMLDTPPEGSLFLVWVPPMLNGGCASDGFVWVDPDQGYSMETPKGYTIEMVQTKSGFIPGQESHTLHTRRRYRMLAGPKAPANAPAPNPNLWLFHYIRADRANQIPVANIPLGAANITQTQNTRRHIASLQQQGLISQKEFFLHDPSTWPSVTFVLNQQMPAGKQQGNVRGGMAMDPRRGYPPNAPAPPSAKRQKLPHQTAPQTGPSPMSHQPSMNSAAVAAGLHDPPLTIDEEEDTSRGDMLDHLTPREIAQVRYTQHHEWMEEVLGSVYPISKIRPVDLGLGLRGELEEITRGLFDPPTFPLASGSGRKPTSNMSVPDSTDDHEGSGDKEHDEGDDSMDPAMVEEFTRRAEAKIREIEAEMERMRAVHQQRLAKIQKTGIIKDAERKLCTGIDFNMFGTVDPVAEESVRGVTSPAPATITDDEIVAIVEKSLGKKIVPRDMVIRWDLETGNEIAGMADLFQEDKDEIMGNTGIGADASAATASISGAGSDANQHTQEEGSSQNNNDNGSHNNIATLSNAELDVNMDNDTLMDEPSNFADAFDTRDLDDEDDNKGATPDIIIPPHQPVPSLLQHSIASTSTPPVGLPSPSPQPGALTPGNTTTIPGLAPSPTSGSSLFRAGPTSDQSNPSPNAGIPGLGVDLQQQPHGDVGNQI